MPPNTAEKRYNAHLFDVHSGDDLILMVDLEVEDLFKKQRIRLHGVDTPIGIGVSPDSEGGKLKKEMRNLLRNKRMQIEVYSKGANSWVCVVHVELQDAKGNNGFCNLNAVLIERGFAFKRKGPTQ